MISARNRRLLPHRRRGREPIFFAGTATKAWKALWRQPHRTRKEQLLEQVSDHEELARSFEKHERQRVRALVEARFHDEYRESVEKLIEAKRKGRKVTPIRQPKTTPVTDLMQALQQSLAKNAKSTKEPARKTARKPGAHVA